MNNIKLFPVIALAILFLFTAMHATADEQTNEPGKPAEKLESGATVTINNTQPAQRLGNVKKIFVASLGTSDGSELIRQKIINYFIESRIVAVVNSPDEADATITGAARLNSGYAWSTGRNGTGGGGTYYATNMAVRLIGKAGQVLWTNGGQRKIFQGDLTCSPTSIVAKALIKAIKKDQKIAQSSNNQHM